MITPERNSFYKKQQIGTADAVKLSALFKDAALSENEVMTLEGGPGAAKFIVTGSIPSQSVYGGGDLAGADLVLFCSGTNLSSMGSMPMVSSYKLKEDITLTEGSMAFSTSGAGGQNMSVYTTFVDPSQPYLAETFDGIPKDMGGNVIVVGSDGSGPVVMKNAWMSPSDANKTVYLGGRYSIFHSGTDPEGGEFMKEWFGSNPETTGNDEWRIPVKPMSKSKPQGKWVPKIDNRNGYTTFTVFKPIWRWNDIKGLLNFERSEPASADVVPPSEINTAFQMLYKTPDNQTAYTADPDGEPWAVSALDMSSTEFKTGGQSLHMAHLWQFTEGTETSDLFFGLEGQANQQFACAAGDLLPYPIPMDYARISTSGTSADWNSASSNSGSTITKPEVDITFKVTDMSAGLQCYTGADGGESAPNKKMKVFDYIGYNSSLSGGAEVAFPAGANYGYAYTGTQGNTLWTLLRSFTICLSSYLPKANENLNDFIDRGMTEFYVNQNYKEGIIGGVSFTRQIANNAGLADSMEPNDTTSLLVATPLLTRATAYRHTYSGKGVSGSGYNPTNRMFKIISGSGAVAGSNAKIIGHSNTRYPIDRGYGRASNPNNANTTTKSRVEPSVALGINEWTTMKIVLDPLGENSGPQPGLARAYFTNGVFETNTLVPLYNEDMPPSVQFYFPASTNTATSTVANTSWPYLNSGANAAANGNWNWVDHPEYWPKYVSLWLTNYKYAPTDDTSFGVIASGTHAGESMIVGESPPGSGAAKMAEVYIDSVVLRNFTNETLNNSAGASYLTMPLSIRDRPVKTYVDDNGVLSYPESAGQGAFATSVDVDTGVTTSGQSTAIRTCHAPTYISFGFESGATDLAARFNVSGGSGSEAGAHMLWNGFATPTFSTLKRQDVWTTHASFMTLSGATGVGTGEATNRLGFWGANRGVTASYSGNTSDASIPYADSYRSASGSLRIANANSRNNKLKIVPGAGAVSGAAGGYDYAGGFILGSGASNTFLSTDGMTQKGFMKFITSGMVASPSGNGDWVKMINPLVCTKIIGLPNFEAGDVNSFFTNNAVIVDNPSLFDEQNIGDTEYMIFTASGGVLTDTQITQELGVAGKRSNILTQSREKEDNVIFFDQDVRNSAAAETIGPICTTTNLPYLWVGPLKYWVNMEIHPGQQLILTGAAKDVPPYLSGSTGADKAYDGISLMGDTSTRDSDILSSTGSTYNEELFFYNSGAKAEVGRSQNYGFPWALDTGDPITTSLVIDQDFGFGAFDDQNQTGGQAAVETAFQDKQIILNYDAVIKGGATAGVSSTVPQAPFGVTVELHEPTSDHSVTIYGNDFTGTDKEQLKPYFAFRYYDALPKLSNFTIEPAINLLEQENLYDLPEESRNAIKFSWDIDGDDLWYTMLHIGSGSIANKYHSSFMWAPLNEKPISPTGAVSYKWYNVGAGRSAPKSFGYLTATGGTLLQTIDGMAGWAPEFAEAGYLSVTSSNISSSTGGEGLDGLNEFTVIVHAIPNGAPAGNNYYYLQNTGAAGSATGGGFAIWLDTIGVTHAQMGIATSSADKLSQGHMQSISKNTLDGTTPLTVAVTYNSGSATGPDFKLFINGVMEDYVRTGVPNPTCTGTHIYLGSGCVGTLEEVITYDKEIYMPQTAGEFLLDTSDLLDKQSDGKAINYQARLFAMDYHNIRGEDPMQVARSKPVSWRVSSI